jgi:hypothetical protein
VITIRLLKRLLQVITTTVVATATLLLVVQPIVQSRHGDIHATCVNGIPVIRERPLGTEHVTVTCVRGMPEFAVSPDPVPTYDPITQSQPVAIPPDFGGWVTVWLNGRPLRTPYDPVRGLQEPGAYVSASTGRVMIPVRFFTAAFGGVVEWDEHERHARLFLGSKMVQVWAAQRRAMFNFIATELDQPSVIFQDRLFVPVRFLMEGFGASVAWDHTNRSAKVTLANASCVHNVYCGEVR